jgi:CubicO group peptidase (beta-lactamase class C family)
MNTLNWSHFERYVKDLKKEENIAGVAVAVAKDGEVIYENGYGYRNLEKKEPVTKDTIFGIASISKSFTALAIMKLESEGKLSTDDEVVKYLPDFKLSNLEDVSKVKIHHLLTHSVGLPPMKRCENLHHFEEHIAYLEKEPYFSLGQPGDYFSYCNDTFLLLGAIIEKVTGRLFRQYVTEHILFPLEMYRSTFSLEEVEKFSNVSTPYVYQRETNELLSVPWPKLGNYQVGGGIRSTVMDLLRYGQFYLDQEPETTKLSIKKEVLQKMWEPKYQIDRASFYGFALKVTPDYHGMTLIEHGGSQPGVSSNFGFVPEEKIVVSVLTNVTGVSVRTIWQAAVNNVLGIPLDQQPNTEPTYEASIEELQPFIGTYAAAERHNQIQVFLENGILKGNILGEIFDLRSSDRNTLVIKKNEKPIKFFFDSNGEVWSAFFGVRMYPRVF